MPRKGGIYKDRKKTIDYSKKYCRQTIWLDNKGYWHSALNLRSTPWFALQVIELSPTYSYSIEEWQADKEKYRINKHETHT